jgi:hypothetical protein
MSGIVGDNIDDGSGVVKASASSTATSVGNLTTGTLAWGTGNQF